MLTLTFSSEEAWDEEHEKFVVVREPFDLHLEHSLLSVSKWEQRFEKPFLSQKEQTDEEAVGYIEAMILDSAYPEDTLSKVTEQQVEQIRDYINAKMSATWFNEQPNGPKSREVITSELIYYWMAAFEIPFQPCETWHLNRLFTLIKVANLKSAPPKKMSRADQYAQQRDLVERRRQELGTRG